MSATSERTREDAAVELVIANAAAKVTKPSPAWDAIHAHIDELLDEIVGA